MSKYTTGEVAKLCGITVRTVQYYDTRNILVPSEVSQGGRRLYTEEDVKRMKVICFLRDAGISINSIKELFSEEDPSSTVLVLLEQQKKIILEEMKEYQEKLKILAGIQKELKSTNDFSIDSMYDIAYTMKNKNNLKRLRTLMIISGIPFGILQWGSIFLWIMKGIWWPTLLWAILIIPYAIWLSKFYFQRVAYICPQCHQVFQPKFKEAFWAKHTPTLRKLTCPNCGVKSMCVETYKEKEVVTK